MLCVDRHAVPVRCRIFPSFIPVTGNGIRYGTYHTDTGNDQVPGQLSELQVPVSGLEHILLLLSQNLLCS